MLCAYLKPLQIPGGAHVCWGASAFQGAHSDTFRFREGEKQLPHLIHCVIASMELKQGLSKRNAPAKAFIWQDQSSAAEREAAHSSQETQPI